MSELAVSYGMFYWIWFFIIALTSLIPFIDLWNQQLTYFLAALILADAEVEITAEKLQTLAEAAGVQEIEPIWVQLYAKALAGQDLTALMTNFSAGGAVSGGAAGAATGSSSGAAAEEAAVEEEEAAKEESDDDMGFGLFD